MFSLLTQSVVDPALRTLKEAISAYVAVTNKDTDVSAIKTVKNAIKAALDTLFA